MRAGQLRHRLTLQQPNPTLDSRHEPSDTWADVATVWADVRAPSGRELEIAKQLHGLITQVVTIRYRDGITADKRFRWGARTLNIVAARDEDSRRRMLIIECTEEPTAP